MSKLNLDTLNDDSLLSTKEVAEAFRINAQRLRNLRWKGCGPRGVKIGRSVRFRLRDVRDWIEGRADESVPTATTNAE